MILLLEYFKTWLEAFFFSFSSLGGKKFEEDFFRACGKMDAGIEKECSALGGLFQLIMNDMKVRNLIKLTFIFPPNLLSTTTNMFSIHFSFSALQL